MSDRAAELIEALRKSFSDAQPIAEARPFGLALVEIERYIEDLERERHALVTALAALGDYVGKHQELLRAGGNG